MNRRKSKDPIIQVPGLTDREALVLRHVIHSFIMSATPVGSRTLSKQPDLGLSAATIRNAMADLEERGLLTHPHTSAGRVPTDMGYRLYVNYMMTQQQISAEEKALIEQNVQELMPDVEAILARTARLLSTISVNLGVVLAPVFEEGRLERIDLVPLSSHRILVVVTVASGLARTVTLEIEQHFDPEDLPGIARVIQQRLVGHSLREIRETIHERLADVRGEGLDVARVFIESTNRLFTSVGSNDVIVEGAGQLASLPEFREEGLRSVLEIVEDREMVLHLVSRHLEDELSISIGAENENQKVMEYSLITAGYQIGQLPGLLGVIGPRRMDYSRLSSLVRYTASLISRRLGEKQ